MNSVVALHELYKYISKYYDQVTRTFNGFPLKWFCWSPNEEDVIETERVPLLPGHHVSGGGRVGAEDAAGVPTAAGRRPGGKQSHRPLIYSCRGETWINYLTRTQCVRVCVCEWVMQWSDIWSQSWRFLHSAAAIRCKTGVGFIKFVLKWRSN